MGRGSRAEKFYGATATENVLGLVLHREYVLQIIDMEHLYCRVYGRVQLVMFRDFATRKARRCRIVGYVHNHPDGSVEVYGEGTKVDLERWLAYLHRGPLLAHVECVEAQWNVSPPSDIPQKSFDSFEIVF